MLNQAKHIMTSIYHLGKTDHHHQLMPYKLNFFSLTLLKKKKHSFYTNREKKSHYTVNVK